jgi:hypothetical protein
MGLKIPEGGSHDSNLLSVGCANECIYARQRIREQGSKFLEFLPVSAFLSRAV